MGIALAIAVYIGTGIIIVSTIHYMRKIILKYIHHNNYEAVLNKHVGHGIRLSMNIPLWAKIIITVFVWPILAFNMCANGYYACKDYVNSKNSGGK